MRYRAGPVVKNLRNASGAPGSGMQMNPQYHRTRSNRPLPHLLQH